VEWGVLVSNSRFGTPRYPKLSWIQNFSQVQLRWALHICGGAVDSLLDTQAVDAFKLWQLSCGRVQLNKHNLPVSQLSGLYSLVKAFSDWTFILQDDEYNRERAQELYIMDIHNVSLLFDGSGGRGILPDKWPNQLKNIPCGYAGGLSPDNITEQLPLITEAAGARRRTWVDMETGVRTEERFDLNKVRAVIEAYVEFVNQTP
jgi:hypothetical protein